MVTALQPRLTTVAGRHLNELEVIGAVLERGRVNAHQARSTAVRSLRSQPGFAVLTPPIPIVYYRRKWKVTEIGAIFGRKSGTEGSNPLPSSGQSSMFAISRELHETGAFGQNIRIEVYRRDALQRAETLFSRLLSVFTFGGGLSL